TVNRGLHAWRESQFALTPTLLVALAGLLVTSANLQAQTERKTQSDRPAQSSQTSQRPSQSGMLLKQWLAKQDADQDGKISLQESSGLMKSNFRRNDKDADGFLDETELRDLERRLKRNAAATQNNGTRNRGPRKGLTDQQVRSLAGDSVALELNVPYREGDAAWKLDLAMPIADSQGTRPAIVMVHGGGWVSGDKRTALFIGQAIEFAKRGYVCVSVNYRLDGEKLPCIQDVKCAVRWLRAHADQYGVDPNRIGAYGNSAGAHLVTMLGVSHGEPKLEGDGPWQDHSSLVQAVAASATPTRPNLRGGSAEARALIAPMSYVTADAPPFLLFHEESDRTVPIENSDEFVAALKAAGASDVTYRRMTDGSGHGVFQKNLKQSSEDMAAFFDRALSTQVEAE
ncbi:MAG: alpha/beta hydrolase fold domain-containing protein, partial [Rubripirellula sp.]